MQATFNTSWLVRKLPNLEPVCTYPGLAQFVPLRESADAIIAFLTRWTQKLGLDGVYLDGRSNDALTAQYYHDVLSSAEYDVNGDGDADSVNTMAQLYAMWAPYLTARLRAALGEKAVMLANSAGALGDSAMNGVTIELEYCMKTAGCIDSVWAQAQIGARPALGAFWLTHAEIVPEDYDRGGGGGGGGGADTMTYESRVE